MGRTFITCIALAAFLAVELMAVQTTEAQRLRNLLRRNNNCNNCCDGCGVPNSSVSAVTEGSATVSDGYVSSPTISSSEGFVVSQPQASTSYAGEIVSSPIMNAPVATYSQPIVSAPVQTYSEPMVQMPTETFMAPQPYVEPTAQFPTEATPYVEGMPTSEYPIVSDSNNSYVAPASFEMAASTFDNMGSCVGCGASTEQASWTFDGGIVDSGIVQGGIIGESSMIGGGEIVMAGETQGQVLGCATGDCGGQSFDSGQIIDGGITGNGQVISSGAPFDGGVVYGGSGFDGGSAEQIISSEIISETPIEASSDSTGTPEVTSPVEPATEGPSDTVPPAPEDDGKEA